MKRLFFDEWTANSWALVRLLQDILFPIEFMYSMDLKHQQSKQASIRKLYMESFTVILINILHLESMYDNLLLMMKALYKRRHSRNNNVYW